jgi:hypothetical protein
VFLGWAFTDCQRLGGVCMTTTGQEEFWNINKGAEISMWDYWEWSNDILRPKIVR